MSCCWKKKKMVYLPKVELGDTRGRGLSPAAVVVKREMLSYLKEEE